MFINYNFKLPVIATNVGHFPETIEDGVNGYLARENDIDHMSEQMQKIIKSPINRKNIERKTKEVCAFCCLHLQRPPR